MESEDLNEWSLFGGQLELVNIDAGNLTMTDSWSDNTPDSLEMADTDIDDIGIMSSLKVVSCSADRDDQLIDCSREDSLRIGVDKTFLMQYDDDPNSVYEQFGARQNTSICRTRVNLPVIIKQVMGDTTSVEIASPRYLIDSSFVDESIIECVEAEAAVLDEYVDIELPDIQAAIFRDNMSCISILPSNQLVAHDRPSPSDDDNDSALSVGSVCDLEGFGISGSDRHVDRHLRKKEQNKTAALRYRLKKRIERGSVQSEYDALLTQNVELRNKVEQMTREISYLKELIAEMNT